MGSASQNEYVADLLERCGITAEEAAELAAGEAGWADYERLSTDDCSELIEWLNDYERRSS